MSQGIKMFLIQVPIMLAIMFIVVTNITNKSMDFMTIASRTVVFVILLFVLGKVNEKMKIKSNLQKNLILFISLFSSIVIGIVYLTVRYP